MATTYDLEVDFPSKNVSTSPYWILAIVRLTHPVTYSRKNGRSIDAIAGSGVNTRDNTLIITGDCISLRVERPKDSHIKTLSAILKKSDKELMSEILPGDWVFAWMVNHEDTGLKLVERIKNGEACNKKDDGLKFVGRAASLFKSLDRTNTHAVTYSFSAYGFREMETQLFYDPLVAQKDFSGSANALSWMAKADIDFNDIFFDNPDVDDNNVIKVLTTYVELLLGKGVPDKQINIAGETAAPQATGGNNGPPFAYVVPEIVGSLLGRQSRNGKGILAFADILDVLCGIQVYPGKGMYPELKSKDGKVKLTGATLEGAVAAVHPTFINKPLWGLLQQFSNPIVNEMYTCLKENDAEEIVPTLVVRQKPFTTDAHNLDVTFGYTKFTDLPRWNIPSHIVHSFSLGRGEASRCNFVEVYGSSSIVGGGLSGTKQRAENPPLMDGIDIQRSGIYSYIATADVTIACQVNKIPTKFMKLIADWSMGNHLCLQGSMELAGIQSAICEGDNIEYDGIVFHIESLSFVCAISGGRKTFHTTLSLSNGMIPGTTSNPGDDETFPIYPGANSSTPANDDPGISGTK